MISATYFFKRLQDVKARDIAAVFPMIAALVLTPLFHDRYSKVWLIGDEPNSARDNGYHFFKYMREHHPEQRCMFVISQDSPDFDKLNTLGETLEYGSLRHWIAYFLCRYNIFSKTIKPNRALCSFMEISGLVDAHNVILQHGVTINNVVGMHSERMKCELLCAATVDERNFMAAKFGHPDYVVQLTGFPRFDALHEVIPIKNRVLIMPTWRKWFDVKSQQDEGVDTDFYTSEYLSKWLELLSNPWLHEIVGKYSLEVIFFPHPNMQKYWDAFLNLDVKIKIASWNTGDVQSLLKSSALLITDYSSVFFDMVYMKRPVIFYQFDEAKFRKYHLAQGYFDYHKNPFGRSHDNAIDVMKDLDDIVKNQYEVSVEYKNEHRRIFTYWDKNNSDRIYAVLQRRRKRYYFGH